MRLSKIDLGNVHLTDGLFKDREKVNRQYLMLLKEQALLQNFYWEAGIIIPGLQVIDDPVPTGIHWGWEAPTCQLRGHFLGHFLSASSVLIANNTDVELEAKLDRIIQELAKCQVMNGGEWIGSIPEKYFDKLERNEYVWSPQYVMHKTILGLLHAYQYVGNETALTILDHISNWYLKWINKMSEVNPHAVYSGEEGGMLEVWATLYEITGQNKYWSLANSYSEPSLFHKLLRGEDPLTCSHANASIPLSHGAAKMYEITGEEKWLTIVKTFWDCAVTQRGSYCTGGQNAGEFWTPAHMLGQYMGSRNQEFCTVYNMVRLADYLFRFTGDTKYADYIELNLYNGFLAQQNSQTGMPTYFLPMSAGSHKKWGSMTHDFWCCHGTMIQAQTLYSSLTYYMDSTASRIIVSQYIPSDLHCILQDSKIHISQKVGMKYYNDAAHFDESDNAQMSRWLLEFHIDIEEPESTCFSLFLRIPDWAGKAPQVTINGVELRQTEDIIKDQYLELKRDWSHDVIRIYFQADLRLSSLSDMPESFAILEGPIVLAGLCSNDQKFTYPNSSHDIHSILMPITEHTYSTFPWLQSCYRTRFQQNNITMVPLYDITDEVYTLYFQTV